METKGIDVAAIPQTAIKVITAPQAFFREMPKTGGFLDPLVFMVVMGVIGGLIQAVLMVVGLHPVAGLAAGLSSVILIPIFVAIFGFVGAAILFVIWKLMGSQESYETAYRCAAYAGALTPITTILGIVPYVGSAIGLLIMTYYIVIASVEVHKIPSQKAWLVFGIIAAVLILFTISAQFAARRAVRQLEETSREMQKQAEEMKKQAEQAGKAAEQWQKEMQKQSEDAKKAAEEMQKQMEEMQKQMKKK
ncbi:MAG: YIP1 family protein [Nitrospiraceae bacterium]|nr:YIP1 family protein [Nitrospiraceae bacterium]